MRNHSLLVSTLMIIGTVFLLSFKVNSQSCPSGMVAYYKLEEKSGTSFEDSFGAHDAAITSSPAAVKGRADIGMGQSFSSAKVDISANGDFNWGATANFSIEFWVKTTDASGVKVMFGSDGPVAQWWIGIEDGNLTWFIRTTSNDGDQYLTSSAINNGTWKHVVCIKQGTSSKIYIDGALASQTTTSFSGSINLNTPINIGYLNDGPLYYFNGSLDEIAIYNTAISEPLISEHYTNGNSINGYGIGYCDGNTATIVTEPDNEATIGSQYTYDVDASGNPKPTYELVTGPSGMTINSTNGQITWTPSSVSDNGQVTVRATNSGGTDEQSFNIYLAESPTCRSNLDAYWSFNKNDANKYVDEIYAYTMTGNSSYASGILDGARSFNGSSDSLSFKDPEGGTESFFDFSTGAGAARNFSIEYWMKTDQTPAAAIGVHVGRIEPENASYYWIGINQSGQIQSEFHDYSAATSELSLTGTSDLRDGAWHHIVLTYNNSTDEMIIYVDGTSEASDTKNFLDFGGNDPLTIGWFNSGPLYWYNGMLDELAVYSKTLSPAEVSTYYGSGNPTSTCQYNYAPAFTSPAETDGTEETAYSYNITVDDLDGDVVTISNVSSPSLPAWLTFTYSGGGAKTATLAGTPPVDYFGVIPVKLRVTDGSVNVDQTFNITIANVNDIPVVTSTPITSASEDSPYTYTITVTDADSDPITLVGVTIPSWITSFNTTTGELEGTPAQGDKGDYPVLITYTDNVIATPIEHSFTITVGDVNAPPIISSQANTSLSTPEDTPIELLLSYLNVTDADNTIEELSLEVQSGTGYTFTGNTVTPDLNATADLSVNVKVRDIGGAKSDVFVMDIVVTSVNDDPEFTSVGKTSSSEDSEYSYTVTATDADGDVLSYSAIDYPTWLAFNTTTHILGGTPDNSNVGDHNVTIRIYDGTVSVDQTFTITVTNTNDVPTITSTEVVVGDDNEFYTYTLTAEDVDVGDVITLSAPTKPAWASFNASTGVLSGTPSSSDANGDFPVLLRAVDLAGASAEQSFSIHVGDANSAPVITSTPVTEVTEGDLYSYTITATDVDEDNTLTFSAIQKPQWLLFSNGLLSGTPTNDEVGNYQITLRVSDGIDYADQSFIIQVADKNEKPVFVSIPDSFSVHQGNKWGYTVEATDNDAGQTLEYSAYEIPVWMKFNKLTRVLEGTPSNDYVNAAYNIILQVTDGIETVNQEFEVEVINVNDIPVVTTTPTILTIKEEADYSYIFEAEDDDVNDVLVYNATTLPSWLDFDTSTGALTGTPDDGDEGDHEVVLTVDDGNIAEPIEQRFTITVEPINDPPVLEGQNNIAIPAGETRLQIVIENMLFIEDPDNDISEITLTVKPGTGYNLYSNNEIEPISKENQVLTVNIEISDGENTVKATISIGVTGIKNTFSNLVNSAYPNPADNEVTFTFNQMSENTLIEFYDISGKFIKKFEIDQIGNKVQLDVSEFKAGIYMYKVLMDNELQVGRLTIK